MEIEIMDVKEWMECNCFKDIVVYEQQKMSGIVKYTLSEAIEQYVKYLKESKNNIGQHNE